MTTNFDGCLFGTKAGAIGPAIQPSLDFGIGKFVHLTAFVANRESHEPMTMGFVLAMLGGAGPEGVQAFEPMHQPCLLQLVQRAIDLQWRAKSMIAQLI